MDASTEAGSSSGMTAAGHNGPGGNGGRTSPAKKQKFSRSRTACYQCRSRKSKCGAQPPDPCPNCIEAHLPCSWPTEDGRSSKARLQRYRNQQIHGTRGSQSHCDVKPGLGSATPDPVLGEGWLDRLLSGGLRAPNNGLPSSYGGGDFLSSMLPQTTTNVQQNQPHLLPQTQQAEPLPVLAPGYPQITGASPGSFLGALDTPGVDPAQFIWAVTSRLPTVEEGSPNEEKSVASDPSPVTMDPAQRAAWRSTREKREDKIVRLSWWRPMGPTALVPGLKKITLKVRVHTPRDAWAESSPLATVNGQGEAVQDLFAPDGAPSTPVMRHLLDVFLTHFGCQFPFIDRADLEGKIESGTASVFLLLSIAAIAARFSTHPAIALPELQPYEYGNMFYARAKALLGSMLGVPSREAVISFILLAHMGFAADSETEVWMMTGLAVRMAIEAGMHLNPPGDSAMSAEDRRLNRLVFWSVLLMDYALAFGVGRQTTFRPEDITQTLPTQEDLRPQTTQTAAESPRSPFPFAARMMRSYGEWINALNKGEGNRDVRAARAATIKEYNALPQDMQWNVTNLQQHVRFNQGSIFLHLHLWMHTILASEFLTGAHVLHRRADKAVAPLRGTMTPNNAAASLWRNSSRMIGDVLVLTDVICPHAYFALPFVNQAWFVAGCCYVKEIELHAAGLPSRPVSRAVSPLPPKSPEPEPIGDDQSQASDDSEDSNNAPPQVDLSRALLTSVATTNISTLQQGLSKLARYWYGAEWIAGALGQRIEGIHDVDLGAVRENFASFVSLPDAGAVRGGTDVEESISEFSGLDFLSLPFDLGEGSGVTEQEVDIPHLPSWVR